MMLPIFLGMVALLLSPPASALLSQDCTPKPAPAKDKLKRDAGYKAVDDYVKNNMVIGLGTGSTAYYAVERVGMKLCNKELTKIIAIPTSERTADQAKTWDIKLATLDTQPVVNVAIDGADSVDPQLNLVKGGGGAHFREKIVEAASEVFVVIVDEGKKAPGLGKHFPVPVEIVPFCHKYTAGQIEKLPALNGCKAELRLGSAANNKKPIDDPENGDEIAKTDNGNYVVDLACEKPIADPVAAAKQLRETIGVVEHGLFTGMTTAVIIAGNDGIQVAEAKNQARKTTWAEWFPEGSRPTRAEIAEKNHKARFS